MKLALTSLECYPCEVGFCFLHLDNGMCIDVLPSYSLDNTWGYPKNIQLCEIPKNVKIMSIDIVWLSLCEKRFYSIESELKQCFTAESVMLLIGLMPFGHLVVWDYSENISSIIDVHQGREVEVDIEAFLPGSSIKSVSKYCDARINENAIINNNLHNIGIRTDAYFVKYLNQYSYRYSVQLGQLNNRQNDKLSDVMQHRVEGIEEVLYDGTHNKMNDGGLMRYHQAGKPKKLAIKWHIGKSEYSAYFWFEEEPIREVFDKFYGAHPDTKTDFIIRIDAENSKYELALYRYGLKEPQVIPENVYQLLVFKNKFEDYRSDNYNQERGAWIW